MLTIGSLVADPSLHLRMLTEGAPGAMSEPIRWVHNTELIDPSPYLRERELVMTNGIWYQGADSAAEFVQNVQGAGGSGIVFGLTTPTPQTPADLVDVCRDRELPLLELAVDVPFTDLSRAAAASYAERRQRELTRMVRRSDALAESVSRGAGMAGVLDVIHRDHPELEVAVVDRMGRWIAGAELDRTELRTVAEALARQPPPLDVGLGQRGHAALFLCGVLGGADAALVCMTATGELDECQRDVLEQTARFVSLELARTHLAQAIEMRFSSELLDMISSSTVEERLVAGRLEGFGIDSSSQLAVWAVGATEATDGVLVDLAEAVREFFVAQAIPAVVAAGSQDVAAIFPVRSVGDDLTAMAERLVGSVRGLPAGGRVVAGLGSVGAGVRSLRSALIEAREACGVLRRRASGPGVVQFSSLGTYHLLVGLQDPVTLRRFAGNVLDPIRQHDEQRGSDLEATVRAFLDHDGHWSRTADALHVHVNTLRNRLARIAELTGRDVMRTEDRVDVFLALRATDSAGSPR